MNEFNFGEYDSLKELFKAIYYKNLKIEDAERKQDKFIVVLDVLDKYKPRKSDYETAKKIYILINAKKFYDGRKIIIMRLKTKYFHSVLKTFLYIKAEMKMKAMMNFTVQES